MTRLARRIARRLLRRRRPTLKRQAIARPVKLRLTPPPWTVSDQSVRGARTVVELPAPAAAAFVMPAFWGRDELPISDAVLSDQHEPPALEAHTGSGCALLRRQVVIDLESSELLRESFPYGATTRHGGLIIEDGEFRTKWVAQLNQAVKIDRPVYLADTDYPQVFGHTLVDVLPKLWALDSVDPRALVATSAPLNRDTLLLLRAAGVPAERLLQITRPIVAPEVTFPMTSFHRKGWLHPAGSELLARLGALGGLSTVKRPRRIYVSRSRVGSRRLVNEKAVEKLVRSRGFTIIHPELMPIEDQIAIFAAAECIVGPAGSAMHLALFARPEVPVLILASEGWFVNADILLNQVPGRLGYVFGERLAQDRPIRGQGDWSIDMAAVEQALDEHTAAAGAPR